jgi:hypothetical protein
MGDLSDELEYSPTAGSLREGGARIESTVLPVISRRRTCSPLVNRL